MYLTNAETENSLMTKECWRHNHTVSLRVMLEKYAFEYYEIAKTISHMVIYSKVALQRGGQEIPDKPKDPETWDAMLCRIESSCNKVGLIQSAKKARRMREQRIKPIPDVTIHGLVGVVYHSFDELEERILDELESVVFYHVDEPELYTTNPFPLVVQEQFSVAIYDMEEAGKCLALKRWTAAAFHSLRVAEAGLGKIRQEYRIMETESWGKYLQELREFALRPENKDRKGSLMVLHARIAGIKDAWRDDTMHIVKRYGEEEAKEVLQVIRNFMGQLAQPLP